MKTIEERILSFEIQNPEECFDSKKEAEIYKLFRDNYLCPILQYPVKPFFLDFAFPEINTCIEYDGSQHLKKLEADKKRENYLIKKGWKVIRIINNCVIDGKQGYLVLKNSDSIGYSSDLEEIVWVISRHIKDDLEVKRSVERKEIIRII